MDEIDSLADQLQRLEGSLQGAGSGVGAFEADLERMREHLVYTGREVSSMGASIGSGLRRGFDGMVFDGMKLSDAMQGVARSVMGTAYSTAMRPVQNAVGGALVEGINGLVSGILPFADGGSFSQGRVMPFAEGGLVSQPTVFPMRGTATGLMGEAGPEAVLPLARGPDGRLGVAQAGGGGGARQVNVVMNITTPDAEGFRRSHSQIAARMGRALSLGQRNA